MAFVVYVTRGRRKRFTTLGAAKEFCGNVFAATGIVLSIVVE
jgi:hypothetical protein